MKLLPCLVILSLLGTSCRREDSPPAIDGAIRVSVSIPPLLHLVRAIGGDDVEAFSLMSESDDPHTFSPTPQSISSLRNAHFFLTIGIDYEKAVCDKIEPMFPHLRIVNIASQIDKIAMTHDCAEHEHGHHHHHHHQHGHVSDPHVWLSLPNLERMAEATSEAFSTAVPEKAEVFAERLAVYQASLAAKHKIYADSLRSLETRSFCVYHPVFGYFSRDYELKQHVVEVDGKAPTPRQLRQLSEEAKEENFKVIFVQPQFTERPAQAIAELIGGTVVRINPLDEDPVAVIGQAVAALAK